MRQCDWGALRGRANTYALMGDIGRAESELAIITPEVGKTIPADSSPAMTICLVQARVDAARDRIARGHHGPTRIVEFFDSRQMAVGAARAGADLPWRRVPEAR